MKKKRTYRAKKLPGVVFTGKAAKIAEMFARKPKKRITRKRK